MSELSNLSLSDSRTRREQRLLEGRRMMDPEITNSPGGFLVFDVGCIECGEDSRPVGFYATREEAESATKAYLVGGRWGRPEWHGEHHVDVYALGGMS